MSRMLEVLGDATLADWHAVTLGIAFILTWVLL
jgi:hypothetical protein